jgi:glycerol-3-phosphate acyltransferase PlsY
LPLIVAAVTGYLLGAIPVSLIVGKLAGGLDVRAFGSGKTGFTNSLRVFGWRRSAPIFLGDLLKGSAAALLPLLYTDDAWARAAGGLAAVAGHIWPIFAGFRGGRGVLTGAGVLLALSPLAALAVIPVAAGVISLTRLVSLASISASAVAALVFIAAAAGGFLPWAYSAAAASGAVLVIAAHHDNIGRLLRGTERRLGQRT